MKISDFSPEMAADNERRALASALFEGVEAMRADAKNGSQRHWMWPSAGDMKMVEVGGTKTSSVYDLKVKGLRLRNVWRDSVVALASIPFSEAPTAEGWPEVIQGTSDDLRTGMAGVGGIVSSLDDQGNNLATVWAQSFLMKWAVGIHFQLIDMPPMVDGMPQPNALPYWISVKANQVLAPETDVTSGKHRLVSLRVKLPVAAEAEIGNDPEDWTEVGVTPRVRLYAVSERIGLPPGGPVQFRDSVMNADREWEWGTPWTPLVSRGTEELTEIPLIPFYSQRTLGPYRDLPPFEDTASEQANHMRKMAEFDARYIRDARNALYIAGANPDDVKAGANFITGPAESTPTVLETTGKAAEALTKTLDSIEQAIRRGNLRPLMSESTVARTATEILADNISASSRLEMSILLDKASIEQGLRYTSILAGVDGSSGRVNMRHDFAFNSRQVLELFQGWVQGGGVVPDKVMWGAARRAGLWLTERDSVDDVAALSTALRQDQPQRPGDIRSPRPADDLEKPGGPQPEEL